MAYGAALAVPAVLGVPVELVTPAKWRLHFNIGDTDKEVSRRKALDLCPWLANSLNRKRYDRRANAIMIGLFAAMVWDKARAA
jgi:crossover junction endodeoxyribonuclease RuvC